MTFMLYLFSGLEALWNSQGSVLSSRNTSTNYSNYKVFGFVFVLKEKSSLNHIQTLRIYLTLLIWLYVIW